MSENKKSATADVAKTEDVKTKDVKFENAVIVPAELADKIMAVFFELPRKFNQLLDPLSEELSRCYRSNVELKVRETPDEEPKLKKT